MGAYLGAVGANLGNAAISALDVESLIIEGAIQGALSGAGGGAAAGYAGGKGSLRDIAKGALIGAASGGAAGVTTSATHRFYEFLGISVVGAKAAGHLVNKAAYLGPFVKPTMGLLSGATGAAVGSLISEGDASAMATGALIGGAFGLATSGIQIGFIKGSDVGLGDTAIGYFGEQTVAYKTVVYGIELPKPASGYFVKTSPGNFTIKALTTDLDQRAVWLNSE